MIGFSFFGKNIFNIWPLIFGVWLYSKYQKEKFANYILIALLSTTLSPTVGQLHIFTGLQWTLVSFIGILISIFVGFIIAPLTSYCMKLHQGYNLYNAGVAGGLIATVLMSIFRSIGIDFKSQLNLHSQSHNIIIIFLYIIFLALIILGYLGNDKSFSNYRKLLKTPGRLVTDFYIHFNSLTFINMGILGVIFTTYMILIGATFNGPIVGTIFVTVGFGAFGKHPRNALPVLIGATIFGLININEIYSTPIAMSMLFSTTLAPISGQFGFKYGILAGFLHVAVSLNVGYIHGGLNLYNSGFAGGLVAIILVPIIIAIRKEK